RAGPPCGELRAQILGPQTHETGDVRREARQLLAVARTARRHTEPGIAFLDELASAGELVVAAGRARRRPARRLRGVVGRDLFEIGLGEVREQVLHDRVAAPPRAIVLELRVEVTGRLAGERREVDLAR